jgi:hypothetical protein
MKQFSIYIYAAAVALALAVLFAFGMNCRSRDFNRTVHTALSESVHYDQDFIGMVDRLEQELAMRASFGYEGGKDPMTGLVRQVVVYKPQKSAALAFEEKAAAPAPAESAPKDPFRLTAIIYDSKVYTAVVMDNERTFSVSAGDKVGNRRIRTISEDAIVMEDDSCTYRYDVSGKKSIGKK